MDTYRGLLDWSPDKLEVAPKSANDCVNGLSLDGERTIREPVSGFNMSMLEPARPNIPFFPSVTRPNTALLSENNIFTSSSYTGRKLRT